MAYHHLIKSTDWRNGHLFRSASATLCFWLCALASRLVPGVFTPCALRLFAISAPIPAPAMDVSPRDRHPICFGCSVRKKNSELPYSADTLRSHNVLDKLKRIRARINRKRKQEYHLPDLTEFGPHWTMSEAEEGGAPNLSDRTTGQPEISQWRARRPVLRMA